MTVYFDVPTKYEQLFEVSMIKKQDDTLLYDYMPVTNTEVKYM